MPRSSRGHRVPLSTRQLLGLPLEVTSEILSFLPFFDVVTVSRVCSDLRKLALAECKLWQTPPDVSVASLSGLMPFVGRAGKLGMDLSVCSIAQPDLQRVSVAIGKALVHLRHLRLNFLTQHYTNYQIDIDCLWVALSGPAPLLESLELIEPTEQIALPALPANIFSGLPPPKLAFVDIRAFQIPAACSAFALVPSVRTSVAAVAPARQNPLVHDLFPSVQSLMIVGIANRYDPLTLARIPPIDRPIDSLTLEWTLELLGTRQDPASEHWLHSALPFARSLHVTYPACLGATNLVLASLSTIGADRIYVDACKCEWHADLMEVSVNAAGTLRSATVDASYLAHHLSTLLKHPGMDSVDYVCVPATVENLRAVSKSWSCPSGAELGLIVEGDVMDAVTGLKKYGVMDGVETVVLHGTPGMPATVDLHKVGRFMHHATPKATTLCLCGRFHDHNSGALPLTVKLEILDQ